MSLGILPYKGNSSFDAAAIHCPYVPLTISSVPYGYHKEKKKRYSIENDGEIYLYHYEDDDICYIIEIANEQKFSIDIEDYKAINLVWILSNYTDEDLLYLKLKDLL